MRRRRSVGLALLAVLLSGCASMGWRPDEPALGAKRDGTPTTSACDEYLAYDSYAQDLQEAYHTRASQNRFWIYGAGILGLGAAAASGGLAAAGAATVGTLALLSISGGFSAGFFATIDNPTLADIYTIAANKIDVALKDARAQTPATRTDATCKQALDGLRAAVSDARTQLEAARTDTAKAALQRAAAQQEALQSLAAQIQQAGDPTLSVRSAVITGIKSAATPVTASTSVELTVDGARLDGVLERDMKVLVGGQQVDVSSRAPKPAPAAGQWVVTFEAPPLAANAAYDVILLVGPNRRPIASAPDRKLQLQY
jgi:hypothetical protein